MAEHPEIIPFKQHNSSRFLPWIVALMIYMGILALGITVVTQKVLEHWSLGLKNGFVVEILHQTSHESLPSPTEQQKVVLDILQQIPDVEKAHVIATSEPGSTTPTLIDVKMKFNKTVDLSQLERELKHVLPNIVVRDQAELRQNLLVIGRTIFATALIFSCVIAATTMITIAFATYSGLITHQPVIDVLRLLGANDRYIAQHFQKHALRLSFRGSLLAILLSGMSMFCLSKFIESTSISLFQQHTEFFEVWFIIFLTPLFMMLMTLIASRMTVLFALAKRV